MSGSAFVLEGDEQIREGESRPVVVSFPQFSTMSTGGTEVYVNGSTVTADYMSGSTVITGNVLSAGTITVPSGQGGLAAVVEAGVNVDSHKYKAGIVFRVLRPGTQR